MIVSAAKYFVVGGLGTVTHLSLLYVAVDFFLIPPLIGSSLAFVWVVIQSYLLNRNWTFQSDQKHSVSIPRYLAVSGLGFFCNLLIMFITVNVLEIWYMLAQTLTILVIPAMNFLLNKYWTFAASQETSS